MKTKLFLLSCFALALASCHSPEERATMNASADSAAKAGTEVSLSPPADATKTDTVAKAAPPKTDTAVVAPPPPPVAPVAAAPAAKQDFSAGEGLLKKADCLACHNISKKIVGPAYQNVAAKYPATDENIETLANKVIAGGSGVWGAVPMTPHPTLSKDDAKEMVKYILSLKK